MMKKAGLDIGYCRTKGVTGTKDADRFSFLSVASDTVETFGLSDVDGIQFDEPRCMVGESAAKFGGFVVRFESRDWYFSESYRQIYYAGLSSITGTSGDISLVTGLPIKFWKADGEAVKRVLSGEHKFKRKDRRNQTVNVSAVMTVQGFGALFNLFMNREGVISDERRAFAPMGIIDAGSKTTNLISVNDLTAVLDESDSFQRGGWDLIAALRDKLVSRFRDLDLTDFEVEAALINQRIIYRGQAVSLQDEIDDLVSAYCTQIKSFISQKWRSVGKMELILLTGGGAHLLSNALKREFPQLVIDKDPIFSNAMGYFKYSQLLEV